MANSKIYGIGSLTTVFGQPPSVLLILVEMLGDIAPVIHIKNCRIISPRQYFLLSYQVHKIGQVSKQFES